MHRSLCLHRLDSRLDAGCIAAAELPQSAATSLAEAFSLAAWAAAENVSTVCSVGGRRSAQALAACKQPSLPTREDTVVTEHKLY